MEPLNNKLTTVKLFMITGLLLLATGIFFGLTGALQYLVPGLLKQQLSFERTRPLHVSSVVFWIILAAMGAATSYLQQHTGKKIWSHHLLRLQLVVFVVTIIVILTSYCFGIFGGREYWEFKPVLALPDALHLQMDHGCGAAGKGQDHSPLRWRRAHNTHECVPSFAADALLVRRFRGPLRR